MKFRKQETERIFENIEQARLMYCNGKTCDLCPLSSNKNGVGVHCQLFTVKFPAEAAHLMGYEVIEDDEDKKWCYACVYSGRPSYKSPCVVCDDYDKFERMEVKMKKQDKPIIADPQEYFDMSKEPVPCASPAKPRLAEVLGVEVGERFKAIDEKSAWFHVNEKGQVLTDDEKDIIQCSSLAYIINHPESIIHAPRLTEAELERCRVYRAKWAYRSTGGQQPVFLCKAKPILYKHDFPVDDGDAKDIIASIWDETMFPSVKPGDCICVEEACRDE